MTTVKEFKELGVPFVMGDKYIRSGGEVEREADGITLGWFAAGSVSALSAVITHFAWRPLNTIPDNPRFKYERTGSIDGTPMWRPLLDQSGAKAGEPTKPVFTQAMADAGELPPVGSRCLAVYEVGVETYEIEVTIAHINGNQVACIDTNNDYLIQYTDSAEYFKPIDTRTPKQKAVDKIVKMLHSEGVVAFDPIMLHIMYEKGFIK